MPHETIAMTDPYLAEQELRSGILHVTTHVKPLKDAVALLKRVAATRSGLLALECIYFRAEAGSSRLLIQAADFGVYAQISLVARIESPGVFAVKATDLNRLLSQVKGKGNQLQHEPITLADQPPGTGECEVRVQGIRERLLTLYPAQHLELAFSRDAMQALSPTSQWTRHLFGEPQQLTLPFDLLRSSLLRTVEQTRKTDDEEDPMGAVLIRITEQKFAVVGADGFTFSSVELPVGNKSLVDLSQVQTFPVDLLVPADVVRHWLTCSKKNESATAMIQWWTRMCQEQNYYIEMDFQTGQDQKIPAGKWQNMNTQTFLRISSGNDDLVLMTQSRTGRYPGYEWFLNYHGGMYDFRVMVEVRPLLDAIRTLIQNDKIRAQQIQGKRLTDFLITHLRVVGDDVLVETRDGTISIRLDAIAPTGDLDIFVNAYLLLPLLDVAAKYGNQLSLAIGAEIAPDPNIIPDDFGVSHIFAQDAWNRHCARWKPRTIDQRPLELRLVGDGSWRGAVMLIDRTKF